ncbi:hypothetical protein AVEN_101167-1 [Araneus ventricosus]|uniref:Uncharacterized protein n=1 Tax=Araneus ventricosus TaxID=182803 RepID=A0A4Y2DG48_ARAVE|nr:hypothetical protein AVEN_101167-1 [Araneus ventricosus]
MLVSESVAEQYTGFHRADVAGPKAGHSLPLHAETARYSEKVIRIGAEGWISKPCGYPSLHLDLQTIHQTCWSIYMCVCIMYGHGETWDAWLTKKIGEGGFADRSGW